MKPLLVVCLSTCITSASLAQSLPVTFTISTEADTQSISPYVYGANAGVVEDGLGITARRLGGNRMTGYNWENNASNAGADYIHSSDDYMTWVFGIPNSLENIPGITLTAFHDSSIARGCYTLLTLPAAGYVARDKDGTVTSAQTAPSPRWRQVRNFKGSTLSTTPDTSDAYVNVDEEVNFLVNRYGPASSATGVKGYDIDNEPALWPSTHPRIHPSQTLCRELIAKVTGAAKAVKSVDPSAEIFGGVFYGFNAYYNFQSAPDWNAFNGFENYAAALLSNMRDSSLSAGQRLLDVLDLHWYPDLYLPVTNENVDSLTVYNRVEAPRTLWDSSYVENGWIGKYFHPQSAALLRKTQRIIRQQYPGTKLSVSEFNYGGSTDISGAVAIADVLGIFGETGVYFGSFWGDITGYIASAYRIYRNYNGHGGTFGDVSVSSTTSDLQNSAIHASLDTRNGGAIHLIAINRNLGKTIAAHFTVNSSTQLTSAGVYALHAGDTQIVVLPGIASIQANQFSFELSPMSVYHFVIATQPASAENTLSPLEFSLEQNYPNPFNPSTDIRYTLPGNRGQGTGDSEVRLVIYDVLGREVATLVHARQPAGSYEVRFDGARMASGVYFYRLTAGNFASTMRMVLTK